MKIPELEYVPTLPVAIRRAAAMFHDRRYLVMPGVEMTFGQAEAASRRVAKQFLARGMGKGTRVALHFSYSPDWVIAFFAASRIGAICLPMSSVYRPAEFNKSVVHGDVDTLIVPTTMLGKDHLSFVEAAFPSLDQASSGHLRLREAPYLRSVLVSGGPVPAWGEAIDLSIDGSADDPEGIDDAFLEAVEAQVVPGDWLMIIHTSGTTGEPKGVIHTHGALIRHSENLSSFNGMTQDSTQFSGLPWFWIGGVVLSIGQGLVRGFTMLALEKFDNQVALELIMHERPVQVGMWGQLAQRFQQYVISTGLDVNHVPALAPRPGGPIEPGRVHNSLGQTESMGPHTAGGPELRRILPDDLRGSFGLPVPCVEHRIVESDTGEDMPPGVEGEVIVRGYSITVGLYKKERHEALDDEGWLHTGDRGYFKNGCLFFTGRFTEMIKTLGSNVAPREVEMVLEEVDSVGLAVVIGVADPEREQVVAAALVPKPGRSIDVDEVMSHVEAQLSSYKVPRHVLVLDPENVPTLGSGKPDKRTISTMLQQGWDAACGEGG